MSDIPQFNLLSLQSLLEDAAEEPEWVVQGLLPKGSTSLVPAKPKTGKSTLARCIAYGVATGTTALGRSCTKGSVIYLALEESRDAVAEHFARMGATGEEPIITHIGAAPSDPMIALESAVQEHRPSLVIVDPLQRFFRFKDLNDYSQVSTGFEIPTEIARHCGCHIMFLHHMGKEEHAGSPSDSILGSTALFASVDLALLIRKTADVRTIQTDGPQRYSIDLPPTVLRYDPETGMVTAGEELAAAQRDEMYQRIMNALADYTLPMNEIKRGVGGDSAKVHGAVITMHQAGFLERSGTGKRGDPYLFWVRKPDGEVRPNGYHLLDHEHVQREAEEFMKRRDQNPLFHGVAH